MIVRRSNTRGGRKPFRTGMSVPADETKRSKRKPNLIKMSELTQKVSSKTQSTEVQKFYDWMAKMNSIHLADNERMSRAFDSVIKNSLLFSKPKN